MENKALIFLKVKMDLASTKEQAFLSKFNVYPMFNNNTIRRPPLIASSDRDARFKSTFKD